MRTMEDAIEMASRQASRQATSTRDFNPPRHTRKQSDIEMMDTMAGMSGTSNGMNVGNGEFSKAVISWPSLTVELQKSFGSLSILALSITLLASWESIAR